MTGTDEKIPAREMHKEPDRHICFLMEKESRTVYYVTTGKETISFSEVLTGELTKYASSAG